MTDPNKLDDVHLLNHLATAVLASERSAYRHAVIERVAGHGLDPKIAEALVDGYAEAVRAKKLSESTSFERELLRRMRPPEAAAAPNPKAPERMVVALANQISAQANLLRLPELPAGPPFERDSLHDFFAAVVEYNEQVARDSTQFAILCRRMCEKIKPEMYRKDGEG